MKKLFAKGCLLALLGLFSCQQNEPPQDKKNNGQNPTTAPAKKSQEKAENQVKVVKVSDIESAAYVYYAFAGKMGEWNITMNLWKDDQESEEGSLKLKGSYSYDHIGSPILLTGTLRKGRVVLEEETTISSEFGPHFFEGLWTEQHISGEWLKNDKSDLFPIELTQINTSAHQFLNQIYQDSMPALAGFADSPIAHYTCSWLSPEWEDSKNNHFLREEFLKLITDDNEDTGTFIGGVHRQRDIFFEGYEEGIKEYLSFADTDSLTAVQEAFPFYEEHSSMNILFYNTQWLTVSLDWYGYSGGAHGMYTSRLATFDLKRQQRLSLETVFKAGYEDLLTTELANAARNEFELEEEATIGSVIDAETIPVTDNFGLDHQTLVFLYDPYEIAAYAVGQITLEIPLSDLASILKPEFCAQFPALGTTQE